MRGRVVGAIASARPTGAPGSGGLSTVAVVHPTRFDWLPSARRRLAARRCWASSERPQPAQSRLWHVPCVPLPCSKAERRAGQGRALKRSALRAASRHIPCDARATGLRRNSLHSLRSFRSNSRRKSVHEARLRRAAGRPVLLGSLPIRARPCPARPSALPQPPRSSTLRTPPLWPQGCGWALAAAMYRDAREAEPGHRPS